MAVGVHLDLRSILPVRQVAGHHVHWAQQLQDADVLQGAESMSWPAVITDRLSLHHSSPLQSLMSSPLIKFFSFFPCVYTFTPSYNQHIHTLTCGLLSSMATSLRLTARSTFGEEKSTSDLGFIRSLASAEMGRKTVDQQKENKLFKRENWKDTALCC